MAPYNSKGRTDARALTKTGQRTSVPARRRLGEGLVAGWAHLLSAVVRTVRYDGTLAQPSPPFWDKRWPRPRQLILIQLRLSRQSRRKPSADTAPHQRALGFLRTSSEAGRRRPSPPCAGLRTLSRRANRSAGVQADPLLGRASSGKPFTPSATPSLIGEGSFLYPGA